MSRSSLSYGVWCNQHPFALQCRYPSLGAGGNDAPLQLQIAVLELTMKPFEFEDAVLGILSFFATPRNGY